MSVLKEAREKLKAIQALEKELVLFAFEHDEELREEIYKECKTRESTECDRLFNACLRFHIAFTNVCILIRARKEQLTQAASEILKKERDNS